LVQAFEEAQGRGIAATGIDVAPEAHMAVVQIEYLEIELQTAHILELDEGADIGTLPILIDLVEVPGPAKVIEGQAAAPGELGVGHVVPQRQ